MARDKEEAALRLQQAQEAEQRLRQAQEAERERERDRLQREREREREANPIPTLQQQAEAARHAERIEREAAAAVVRAPVPPVPVPAPAPAPASAPRYSPEEVERARFERLLGTEGLSATVYLPTREGSAKSKSALLRCERGSSSISCEVKSGGQKKKLKFDVGEVMIVSKGPGSAVNIPSDVSHACLMHFKLKEKPELNIMLDSSSARDATVLGFMQVRI